MRLPKEKYLTKDTELLHQEINELMSHYGRLAANASKARNKEQTWYNNGIAEGMNKLWKLLFIEDVDVKSTKKY